MPRDDTLQGTLQRVHVHAAGQAQRASGMIGGTGAIDLGQEPQALLRKRQRHVRLPLGHRDRTQLRGVAARQTLRQLRQHRRFEHPTQRQFHAQALAHARTQLHRQQRMPAQFEEAIVAADLIDLQQLAPQLRQALFDLALWRLVRTPCIGTVVWRGQRLAVELAVRGQRPGLQLHERRRHHVLGQLAGQPLAQRTSVQRLVRGAVGQAVRHQPRLAALPARDHHRLAHPRAFEQLGFDLAQFDAETADLHLEVVATRELQAAVRRPTAEVAGAVHARARLAAERIGDIALRGQRLAVQIARRDAIATDPQLSGHPDRNRLTVRVQHVHPGIGDRTADADARFLRAQRRR
ncbi:hypothetical protein, partial [Xanthomonas sp. NCPPB 1128]|uniref:hypothetical protein n=1 Tax=Xanthomonas sp. NCPPB 1128 TaxID=1775876 RepID=UPI0031B5FABA